MAYGVSYQEWRIEIRGILIPALHIESIPILDCMICNYSEELVELILVLEKLAPPTRSSDVLAPWHVMWRVGALDQPVWVHPGGKTSLWRPKTKQAPARGKRILFGHFEGSPAIGVLCSMGATAHFSRAGALRKPTVSPNTLYSLSRGSQRPGR